MKWCRFQAADQVTYGIIEDDTVVAVTGSPFETYTKTSTTYPLQDVKLLVPVIPLRIRPWLRGSFWLLCYWRWF